MEELPIKDKYRQFIDIFRSNNYYQWSAINEIISKIKGTENFDIYEITDIDEFNRISKELEDNQNFIEINRIGKNQYSNTIIWYKIFLTLLKKKKDNKVEKINLLLKDETTSDTPFQQIFYGAPGTGKSHFIKDIVGSSNCIRTTFHPDSDYSTFVGAYKPTMGSRIKYDSQGNPEKNTNGEFITESSITYKFVQQAFAKAYVAAWKNYPTPEYLVIEEINRGNCAQIFGDLFQLLDRNDEGFSEYSIAADDDLRQELARELVNSDNNIKETYPNVFNGEELLLPNNLYIWATMNTSDQSLFPIDSAFKRRWEWKYVPISNAMKDYFISVKSKKYDWWKFLERINQEIEEATTSEDKKMGYFFCKATNNCISVDKFVGKVLFYLWNDVFKDYGFESKIFKNIDGKEIKFQQFFNDNGSANEDTVITFLNNLGLTEEKESSVLTASKEGEQIEEISVDEEQ